MHCNTVARRLGKHKSNKTSHLSRNLVDDCSRAHGQDLIGPFHVLQLATGDDTDSFRQQSTDALLEHLWYVKI